MHTLHGSSIANYSATSLWRTSIPTVFRIRESQNPLSRCWFQTFFIFTPIWGRFPFWLIFFKGVETTNQLYHPGSMMIFIYFYPYNTYSIRLYTCIKTYLDLPFWVPSGSVKRVSIHHPLGSLSVTEPRCNCYLRILGQVDQAFQRFYASTSRASPRKTTKKRHFKRRFCWHQILHIPYHPCMV